MIARAWRWMVSGLVTAMAVSHALGATQTWTSAAPGYWTNAANWSGGVPGALDEARFDGTGTGDAIIDGDVTLGDLIVTNGYSGTIYLGVTNVAGDLTAGNGFYLASGATLVPRYSSTNGNGAGRAIAVGGNATIDGTINAQGQGFPHLAGPGAGSGYYAGGSHGGWCSASPRPYGSVRQPISLGSGGGNSGTAEGGGAVKIDVGGTLTLDGTITADGNADGSAGGSVWLLCQTLAGSGAIRAEGRSSALSQGTGGRVSLEYTNATFTGTVSVAGGTSGYDNAQPGTLWEPGRFAALRGAAGSPAAVTITNSYQYFFPDQASNYWDLTVAKGARVYFHDGALAIDDLVATNGAHVRFDVAEDGSQANAGLNADLRVGGSVAAHGGRVVITDGTHSFSNLVMSSGACVYLPPQTYSLTELCVPSNSTLYTAYPHGDTNAVNADSGGTTNSPHGCGTTIVVAGDVTIEPGGTINGDGLGFPKGPGAGTAVQYNGASYGGMGGSGKPLYGAVTRPTALGSGGHKGASPGGSALKLAAPNGTLTVDGTITMQGVYAGGSGGSIWLQAEALAGSGTVNASGGPTSWQQGGGGRVALEYGASTFSGTIGVTNGPGGYNNGYPGTLFECLTPTLGVEDAGLPGVGLKSAFGLNGGQAVLAANGVKVTRSVTVWQTNAAVRLCWTDASSGLADEPHTNTASYAISGLATQTDFDVYQDDVFSYRTNSGLAGVIGVTNVNLFPSRTLEVKAAPAGLPAVVWTYPPTNVTSASACLNGYLSSTGSSDTAVLVYWGPTDGGTDAGNWQTNAVFAAPLSEGPLSTTVSLTGWSEVFYRYAAQNMGGVIWAPGPSGYLVASGVTLGVAPLSVGEESETATFCILRSSTATSMPLTVYFAVGGTATNGVDYDSIGTNAVLATGATNADITVTTIRDLASEPDETLAITLLPGAYAIGTPGEATLTITNTSAQALASVWVSDVTASWTDPAAWSAGVPIAIDTAVFDGTGTGDAVIGGDVTVGNLSVSGSYSGTIYLGVPNVPGDLAIGQDLYLGSGAVLVPRYSSTNGNGTGRAIIVGGNATLDGTIDAQGQGFLRLAGPGAGTGQYAAGSHGGWCNSSGRPYGSIRQPTSLGSGGGNSGTAEGGGAVKIDVGGTLTLDGTITADGNANGSAGGSVWLLCRTLAGSGTIRAEGRSSALNQGAGGRVSLEYTNATFTGTVSVAGGTSGYDNAQPGTLWEPGRFAALRGAAGSPAAVTITNSYQYFFPDQASNYWDLTVAKGARVYFHDGALAIDDLVATNGAHVRFDVAEDGSQANVGLNADLRVGGSVAAHDGRVVITDGTHSFSNLVMSGVARVYLSPQTYSLTELCVPSNSTLYTAYPHGDTNAVNADSGGTTNSPHGCGTTIAVAGDVTIEPGGTINGDGLGFPKGPGAGTAVQYNGASYGGMGGSGMPLYGAVTRPTALGSGGHKGASPGGSALKLAVPDGTLTVDGTITMQGVDSGGSGGSIWLQVEAMAGSGTLNASGGRTSWHQSGGGRVALEYGASTFSGTIGVTNGPGGYNNGYPGTLFECVTPTLGVENAGRGGVRLTSAFSPNGGQAVLAANGVRVARTVSRWRDAGPRLEWTDGAADLASNPLVATATYTLFGLPPRARMAVYDNAALYTNAVTTADGVLSGVVIVLDAPHTIRVEGGQVGSVMLIR